MGTDTGAAVTPVIPSSSGPRINLHKWIGRLSSSVILAGAAAYFPGFFVVNSYLYGYGISPFDFVQPRSISAGLLYLSFTVLLSTFLWFAYNFIRTHIYVDQPQNAERRAAWLLQTVVTLFGTLLGLLRRDKLDTTLEYFGLALMYVSLFLLAMDWLPQKPPLLTKVSSWWQREIIERGRLKWIMFIVMLFYISTVTGFKSSAFYYCFFVAIALAKSIVMLNPNQTPADKATTITILPILSLGLLWASLYLFGTYTYPLLPSAVGGGKPALVAIALKPDSLKPDHRKTIGAMMGREDWKCVMQNVEVIHENNDILYVLPHGYYSEESELAIPKSQIIALAYQKTGLDENSRCYE
jgi:hypothetical protein